MHVYGDHSATVSCIQRPFFLYVEL